MVDRNKRRNITRKINEKLNKRSNKKKGRKNADAKRGDQYSFEKEKKTKAEKPSKTPKELK